MGGNERAPGSWRVSMQVPAAQADPFADAIGDGADAVSLHGDPDAGVYELALHFRRQPDPAELAARVALLSAAFGLAVPETTIEAVPATDWLAATQAAFPPLSLGRFWIHGSHVTEPRPVGRLPLQIDATTAFGTGEHPTTEGCLRALAGVAKHGAPRRVLDMGCGTGILALAAARLLRRPVLAVDLDHEAVRVARINTRVNGLSRSIRIRQGDGFRVSPRSARYDLILANILARPLAEMAPSLADHLAPGGHAILSGLLTRQAAQVSAAYRRQGLVLCRRYVVGDWPTLVVRRPPSPAC